ncbi:hypothetical protein O979_17760 [Mycobacterium avium subsp. paratuberculosis 10-4404]|nr:hypothetical protein O979_17760 [Mycobacterium avium subsp. paratuberculosis 10-4404]
MAPLITLVVGSLVAWVVGRLGVAYVDGWAPALAVGLAAMFVLTGIAHFAPPLRADLVAIVPPRLPAPACWSVSPGCSSCWARSACCCRQPGRPRPAACWC